MNICIPIDLDKGLNSPVCAHFGSAPIFMIVDTDSGDTHAVVNANQHHGHGQCMPLKSLREEQFDAIVVGGIGQGALGKLKAANIDVYITKHSLISEVVDAFKAGSLKTVQPGMACAQHRHRHGRP